MSPGDEPLADGRPILVVRARVNPSVLPEFRTWYRDVHLPHMLQIPGMRRAYVVARPGGPVNWMTVFEFAADSDVQAGLESNEAQRSRDDWGTWAEEVSSLSIEIYASLAALPAFHHWN